MSGVRLSSRHTLMGYRKMRTGLLHRQFRFNRRAGLTRSLMAGWHRAVNVKHVGTDEVRDTEGKALDVVPMVMGQEVDEMSADQAQFHQEISENGHARATVQNEPERASFYVVAVGVAAILDGGEVPPCWGRQRSSWPEAPDYHFRTRVLRIHSSSFRLRQETLFLTLNYPTRYSTKPEDFFTVLFSLVYWELGKLVLGKARDKPTTDL